MPAWEYKFITSGKGGFATPALLESFLNQLGQEEWEILEFKSPPDNPLAFSGLARRSTQREWTLADAATAAAKAETDKLRAEFEAKFKGAGAPGAAAAEEPAETPAPETDAGDRAYRRPRNTESDLDPDLAEEEGEGDDWDKIAKEDELPTFFEAIQPLMRRNQRGEGLAASVEHLAKRWNLSVADVVDALKECGFAIPEDENTRPAYVEYDGDLFWVNMNRRGELWINTKEKPRPVFRVVPGRPVAPEEIPAKADEQGERRKTEGEGAAPPPKAFEAQAPQDSGPGRGEESSPPRDGNRRSLPEGPALLERIHPLMRRERGGAGRSGSIGFLCRALKCRDNELTTALEEIGLKLPGGSGEPPVQVDLAGGTWWLYRDQRGGIWINQRPARNDGRRQEPAAPDSAGAGPPAAQAEPSAGGEAAPIPAEALSSEAPVVPSEPAGEDAVAAPPAADPTTAVLAASRLLLKPTKTGGVAAEVGRLAETVGKSPEDFLAALVNAGLIVPEKPREKPVFVEHAGEIFWLNKNAKDELWLNAKVSKFASGSGEERKPRGRRSR